MSKEDSITRTTLYLPKYLHETAKDAGVNFSKEFTRYLETVLYGDQPDDMRVQYDQLKQQEKKLEDQLTSVRTRLKEISEMLETVDERIRSERELYERFLKNAHARIRTGKQGANIDYGKLASFWKHDFFPGNGVTKDLAKTLLARIDCDDFDFDSFKKLRRGANLES